MLKLLSKRSFQLISKFLFNSIRMISNLLCQKLKEKEVFYEGNLKEDRGVSD